MAQLPGPSQPLEPELSEASSGIRSPCWTLGALAPAPALLNPVGGEGLLLRTSGNVPVTRLITSLGPLAMPSLIWGPSCHTVDSHLEGRGSCTLVNQPKVTL